MSDVATFAKEELKSFIERVERLEEEIKALNSDKSDVFSEAKSRGYDVKALKKIVALRRQDADERKEFEAVLDTYLAALGMLPEGE
jgi:uncharacterized protein (UPF0335 family)